MREDIENMKKEVQEMKDESDLFRILKLEDRKNKRLCWIIILLIILLVISVCYNLYLHNDIGTTTTTETYEQEITDFESINNSSIINAGNSWERLDKNTLKQPLKNIVNLNKKDVQNVKDLCKRYFYDKISLYKRGIKNTC